VAAGILGAPPVTWASPSAAPPTARGAAGGLVVSPQPHTPDASPRTQISFLGAPLGSIASVSVRGSRSGRHAGHLRAYAAERGASMVLRRPFAAGEEVKVRVRRRSGHAFSFSFGIGSPGSLRIPRIPKPRRSRTQPLSFASRPDLRPAPVTVTTNQPGTAPGEIFIGPLRTPQQPYDLVGRTGPLILDANANPLWFYPLPSGISATDVRPRMYHGQLLLGWWQGRILPLGFGQGVNVLVDSSYRQVATVRAGNGYQADLHGFQLTPQGTALMTIYSPVTRDLRSVHGPANGVVVDCIVQEVDVPTGLVMYEWHSLGHLSLRESYAAVPDNGLPYDPFHINSIDLAPDGNLLISARNTWGIYEIQWPRGRIAWRLGGKRSSFATGPGVRFAWQHDAHLTPDGTLTLFDNEALPRVGPRARGLSIRLDPSAGTATLAREYTQPQGKVAGSQGNLQRLPNGDVFVGWGAQTSLSEFSANGRLLFDAHLPRSVNSYRAFRAPWVGRPADRPSVAARRVGSGQVTVSASWNGATEVAAWRVLAGPDPGSLAPVGSPVARNGFETSLAVGSAGPTFGVQALDQGGNVLGSSSAVRAS